MANKANSDTPLTDAAIRDFSYHEEGGQLIGLRALDIEFGRQLERKCAHLESLWASYDRTAREVQKANDELNAALMEKAVKNDKLYSALEAIEQRAADNMNDRETVHAVHAMARKALARSPA